MIGFDLLHASDAERVTRRSVWQEQGEAVVERSEEGHVQDVAGVDEAKDELQEIIDFPGTAEVPEAGGRIPKGVLLMGLPKHRQDAAGARRSRRSQRTVLFDQRLGLRGDVRRRGRLRVRDLFEQGKKTRPASSSSTKSTRSAAIAAPGLAAATTSANRR